MDLPLLLVLLITILILTLISSIQIFAYYIFDYELSRPLAILQVFVIIIGLVLSILCSMFMPMDIMLNSAKDQISFQIINSILTQIQQIVLAQTLILIPLINNLQISEQQENFLSTFFSSIIYTIIHLVVLLIIIIVSQTQLKQSYIPSSQVQCDQMKPIGFDFSLSNLDNGCIYNSNQSFEFQIPFALQVMGAFNFIGMTLMSILVGVGLGLLPLHQQKIFKACEIPINTEYVDIVKQVDKLKNLGKLISQEYIKLESESQLTQFYSKFKLDSQLMKYKNNVSTLEYEYHWMQEVKGKKNPQVGWLQFSICIVCSISSLMWIIHMMLIKSIETFGLKSLPLNFTLDRFLQYLQNNNQEIVSQSLYSYLVFQLYVCMLQTISEYGYFLLFFINVARMKPHETHINSFLQNLQFILISSLAINVFCNNMFPTFSRNTNSSVVFGLISSNMKQLSLVQQFAVFEITILIGQFLGTFQECCKNQGPRKQSRFDEIRSNVKSLVHDFKTDFKLIKEGDKDSDSGEKAKEGLKIESVEERIRKRRFNRMRQGQNNSNEREQNMNGNSNRI